MRVDGDVVAEITMGVLEGPFGPDVGRKEVEEGQRVARVDAVEPGNGRGIRTCGLILKEFRKVLEGGVEVA